MNKCFRNATDFKDCTNSNASNDHIIIIIIVIQGIQVSAFSSFQFFLSFDLFFKKKKIAKNYLKKLITADLGVESHAHSAFAIIGLHGDLAGTSRPVTVELALHLARTGIRIVVVHVVADQGVLIPQSTNIRIPQLT